MKPTIDIAIHLLHAASSGTLATHSLQLPGYPFATTLPFVPDEHHCPVFLVSSLAEHTKNLLADSRASFLISSPNGGNVLAGARMTMTGDATRIEPSAELLERYIRHHPDTEHYLSLGDFAFFRLVPKRIRHIAGFGHMGWIEETEWVNAAVLKLTDETDCLKQVFGSQQAGVRLLGIDCYGCDIEHHGKRDRLRFNDASSSPEKIGESVKRLLATL